MGKVARSEKARQTVREHLRELRRRFFICIGVFIFLAIAIYFVYEPIIKVLSTTLGSELYYNTPAGGFSFVMRICTTGAIVFTVPVIVFNIIRFIKPAFEKILSTKKVIMVSIFSTILAASGALFAYCVILPESLHFFSDFNIAGLNALISADEYLNFVTNMIVVFAIVFQVPLLMLLADNIKPIPPKKLFNNEIWVVVISLIVAIITPFNYDIISSLVIAIPIVGLYNLSIAFILTKHFIAKNNTRYTLIKPTQVEDFCLSNSAFEAIKEDIINLEISPSPAINTANISKDYKLKTITNNQEISFKNKLRQQIATQQNAKTKVFFDIIPHSPNHA